MKYVSILNNVWSSIKQSFLQVSFIVFIFLQQQSHQNELDNKFIVFHLWYFLFMLNSGQITFLQINLH